MKQGDFEIKTTEDFEIVLESETHAIGSSDLISVLENYRQLLKGVNVTLNRKYCAGFDMVDFDVIALEHGSFKIPIKIKKFSNAVAINVVGGILVGLFLTEIQSSKVTTPTETIEVQKEDLMDNHDTKAAVVNIAKTVVQSDNISGLSLNYTKEDGSQENIKIEKTKLESIAAINTEVEPDIQSTTCNIRLTVVAPVLDDKKVQWKFKTQTGQNVSAKMDDEIFLEKLDKEHIAFGKHDVLEVELETMIISNDEALPKVSYRIKKVIDYPKYKKNNSSYQTELDL